MQINLSSNKHWKKWLASTSFLILLIYTSYSVNSKSQQNISASKLSYQIVKQGNVDIYANAYGVFIPAHESLLTAPAQGKVVEILARPGMQVNKNTIVLRLINPKLTQRINEASGEFEQQQAQLQAFKFEQQNAKLTYQGGIADIEAEIEKAQLELNVNENLKSLGVVAKIELQRAKLVLKQQQRKLAFEQQKFIQFIAMQKQQLNQKNIAIKQQQTKVNLLKQQQANMNVKASIKGELQTLTVELGQSVQLGQSLAKVGSSQELIAQLRLPQAQADQIDINANVIINTQKGLLKAHISRIESIVTKGAVLAEAILDQPLTSNARPALPIAAQVFVKHQKNALYIKQTAGLRPNSKQSVFIKTATNTLQQRQVVLGELSQGKLVVISGLQVNEQIVTNNLDKYQKFQQLTITK